MNRSLVLQSLHVAAALAILAIVLSPLRAADPSSSSSSSAVKTESGSPQKSPAEKPPYGKLPTFTPSFDSVQWAGPGVALDDLRGKTTVVISFVTWCPKCNVWAPKMLDQISQAIKDKPVVIVAVATDVDAAQGKSFIVEKGLTGPNVLYGANPKMSEQLGVEAANLWNYAWIDPQGALKSKGAAGARISDEFIVATQINSAKDLGKLEFLTPDMPPVVKEIVWPIEMGDMTTLVKVSQPKNLRALPKDDQEALRGMSIRFLDGQVSAAKDLATGDVPKKIEAFDKASRISTAFSSTAQGKEAKKLVSQLTSEAAFRRELSARKIYDQGVAKAGGDDVKLVKNMRILAQRFPDTYYGGLAKQSADSEK